MNKKKLLYVKEGKRYVPIAEHMTIDYFGFGNYLLHVCKGGKSFRLIIEPEYAKVLAALYEYHNEACKVLMDGLKARKSETTISEKAQKLWEELREELHNRDIIMYEQSANDVINGFIEFLKGKVKENENKKS